MDVKGWIFARRARGGPTAPAGRHERGNAPTVTQFCVQGPVNAENLPEVLTRTVTHEKAHRLAELTGSISSVRVEYLAGGQAPSVRVEGYDRVQVRVMWAGVALDVALGRYANPYERVTQAVQELAEHPDTQPIQVPDLSHTLVAHEPVSEHEES